MSAKRKPFREEPPPVLDGFRVLEYAIIKAPVRFSGKTHFFVGDREMGRVPRLALGERLGTTEIAILHLDRSWRVLGAQGGYKSVRPAKERAERMYPGISAQWTKTNVSKREARRYEKKIWEPFRCSFCGKTPLEFKGPMAASPRTDATICHECVRQLFVEFTSE